MLESEWVRYLFLPCYNLSIYLFQKNQLSLLSPDGMALAVKRFVEKEEKEAIDVLVHHELSKTQVHLYTTFYSQICLTVVRFF